MAETKRNYKVDYFKYFCAVLIIFIHARPLDCISKNVNDIVMATVPRIAVPFFFIASGYFYAKKLYEGKNPFKAYALKLITVYSFWSVIYAIRMVIKDAIHHKLKPDIVKTLIIKYFLYGTSEHLWFCIALLIAICFLTLIHKLKISRATIFISLVILILCVLGVTYRGTLGIQIPVLKSFFFSKYFFNIIFRLFMFGICFVFLGDFIAGNEQKLTSSSKTDILLVIVIILHIAEKVFNIINGDNLLLNLTLYPLILLIFITLLRYPGSGKSAFSKYSRNASAFSYYSHSLFITLTGLVVSNSLLRFVIVTALCLAVSIRLTKLNNKKLNYVLM